MAKSDNKQQDNQPNKGNHADNLAKLDSLFADSPANVRVKAANGHSYSGQVAAPVVSDFIRAAQQDAAQAMSLANAKTLKKAGRFLDAVGQQTSTTQSANV